MNEITVTQIRIYPVKSLGGIALTAAQVEDRGLQYDRRWMIVDNDGRFITQREEPSLATVRLAIEDGSLLLRAAGSAPLSVPLGETDGPKTRVQVWKSECTALVIEEAAGWLTNYLGRPVRLVRMPERTRRAVNPRYKRGAGIVSFADGYPVLLAGEASLVGLNERLAAPIPMDRFRPNVVISGAPAFAEDQWTLFRIGSCLFHGIKPCARCVMTTIDQETGTRTGSEPLHTLAQYRLQGGKVLFGQNITPDKPGVIQVGDRIEVLSAATPEPEDAAVNGVS